MDAFTNFLGKVDDIVWGLPLIILIIVCGIYLTIRLKFLLTEKPLPLSELQIHGVLFLKYRLFPRNSRCQCIFMKTQTIHWKQQIHWKT